jgi:hypothetical protein
MLKVPEFDNMIFVHVHSRTWVWKKEGNTWQNHIKVTPSDDNITLRIWDFYLVETKEPLKVPKQRCKKLQAVMDKAGDGRQASGR